MKILVAVGSYERILYGIDITLDDEKVTELKESFAIPAHTGYIKTVSSCPRFLVSGGTDETIRIFDLKRRKDIGSLSQHQGNVTASAWVGDSHFLSGGEDGRVGLFRSKDWECLHILRHKKPVHGIAVHPSGKLALSVGKDKSLKLWNLLTGKLAHSGRLSHEPSKIAFSELGKFYAVLSDHYLSVFESESEKLVLEYRSKTRLSCMAFHQDSSVVIGGEGSEIQIIDIKSSTLEDASLKSFNTDQSPRIKDLAIHRDILVTASSSGLIKGWKLPTMKELFSHNSTIRITCITVTNC